MGAQVAKRYPWKQWFDGQLYTVERDDYDGSTYNFTRTLRFKARRHGLGVDIWVDGDRVNFRYTTRVLTPADR